MVKVVIWGSVKGYEMIAKVIELEIFKRNIEVVGIAFNESITAAKFDGMDVLELAELYRIEYDYVIDMNPEGNEIIEKMANKLKIPKEKRIPARVFCDARFCFDKYLSVRKNPVSIIASHCWGGVIYHSLALPFSSPFINLFVQNEDFFKLIKRIEYYMQQELVFVESIYDENLKYEYPVFLADDIHIYFQHYRDVNMALEAWERRKKRINYDNILVEMVLSTEEEIDRFLMIPYKKIGFTYINVQHADIIVLPQSRSEQNFIQKCYNDNLSHYICDKVDNSVPYPKEYDALKLLNHEVDFRRFE